jgi:multidrug efflux pump subunit AcrA (membrane-fusion protein)
MTANAAIQTATKQDVLVVPSSAVKTQNGVSYVQVFDPPLQQTGGTQGVASAIAPRQIEVEIGIADDTNVEIVSGLEKGQQVVTRTISGTTTNAPAVTGNATNRGGGGLGGTGGGGVFIPR